MAFWPSWSAQVAGRLIAGLGGVLLNVLMSKMVTDWFSGREIASAMAIFVNSWPIGIAAALVVLPPAGAAFGIAAVHLVAATAIGVGFVILAVLYRAPPSVSSLPAAGSFPMGTALFAVLLAGAIWSLYNVGFAMIFGFGPAMLAERGWTVAAAGSAVSIVMWLTMLSVPAGGFLADWTRRHVAIIAAGCVLFAGALIVAARTEAVIASFVVLGIVCGVPAGPIMSLPARVLGPETRSVGMGIYFTVFYVGMFAAPVAAGWLAARLGGAASAVDFGAAAVLFAALLAWVFPKFAASVSASSAAARSALPGAAKP